MTTTAKKKKGGKIWWILSAVLIVVLMIASKKCGKEKGTFVTISSPERKTIVETIPANGKIQPVTEVKISPDVSGEIVELHVKEGDVVKKGELLIKIKQDIYLSAVDQAMASLNSVKSSYKQQQAQTLKSKQNYDRAVKLYELKTISKAEYESACADWDVAQQMLDGARYNISSAEAHLKEARENLLKTTIYSPMDGVVSKLSVELGERVVGTSQMAGTEMLRVANFDQMEVLVDVNENDIIRLNPSDSAQISVDAYPGRKFDGVVTEVANSSKNSSSTSIDQATTFEVKVRILPQSYADLRAAGTNPFRPGMSASVQINTCKVENVLTLPISAITTRSDLQDVNSNESKQFVFLYDKKTQSVQTAVVKTGIQDLSNIEITEGLSDSSSVVTGPFTAITKTLKNGTKVKISK
ncbi:MAG: efflux RND transporter periplasmic adaptor subunit [Bacteroidales bacterium]|nr:efflux RND transporter periplasmic adaptor subunit [Bacteroidales bacterium]